MDVKQISVAQLRLTGGVASMIHQRRVVSFSPEGITEVAMVVATLHLGFAPEAQVFLTDVQNCYLNFERGISIERRSRSSLCSSLLRRSSIFLTQTIHLQFIHLVRKVNMYYVYFFLRSLVAHFVRSEGA